MIATSVVLPIPVLVFEEEAGAIVAEGDSEEILETVVTRAIVEWVKVVVERLPEVATLMVVGARLMDVVTTEGAMTIVVEGICIDVEVSIVLTAT